MNIKERFLYLRACRLRNRWTKAMYQQLAAKDQLVKMLDKLKGVG